MNDTQELSDVAAEFRRHFDQYYLGVIPRLLNEEGLFLAFLSMLAAVESLAGTYMPDQATGDRFRAFVSTFFPKTYEPHVDQLWRFRNRMIHSFNPSPFMVLCRNSRLHLCDASGVRMLNAEDFYADLVTASRAYFSALYSDLDLQERFGKRVTSDDGGRPTSHQVVESVGVKTSAV
jgi:hypothetical protein